MFESPSMMGPLLAAINVSPSQARPRIPMTAVMPAWHVLVLTIAATGALVSRRMRAAIASMMIAMVIGMLTVIGAGRATGDATGAAGAAGRLAGSVVAVS